MELYVVKVTQELLFEQARLAIANGANSMTHVFNGMTKFHHREPGLVGAAMRYRDVYGEIFVMVTIQLMKH